LLNWRGKAEGPGILCHVRFFPVYIFPPSPLKYWCFPGFQPAVGLVFLLIVKGPIILPLPKVYYNFSNKSPFKHFSQIASLKDCQKKLLALFKNVDGE